MPTRDPIAAALVRALRPPRPTGRGPTAGDLGLAAAVLLLQTVLAVGVDDDGRRPDLLGWTLLTVSGLALLGRRRAPMATVVVVIGLAGPYHALNYSHVAAVPSELVALHALAVAGPPLRSFLTVAGVVTAMTVIMATTPDSHAVGDMLRGSGWVIAVVVFGETVRIHRNYVAAIVERAERAERTREEEAARRVAEERLRIARDLHDLLAHSITLIGVQTSVAAHVLRADPGRLDRTALAHALDDIADICRDARAELRTTLEVLRAGDPGSTGALPGLSGLPDLVRAAESAGAEVELSADGGGGEGGGDGGDPVPAAVGAAAYRIVQEALTNAVRHAGPQVAVRVVVERTGNGGALRVGITDDGGGGGGGRLEESGDGHGFGITGMRERARSVGGSLRAGPRPEGGGFEVTAILPLGAKATAKTADKTAGEHGEDGRGP